MADALPYPNQNPTSKPTPDSASMAYPSEACGLGAGTGMADALPYPNHNPTSKPTPDSASMAYARAALAARCAELLAAPGAASLAADLQMLAVTEGEGGGAAAESGGDAAGVMVGGYYAALAAHYAQVGHADRAGQ